MLTWGVDRYRYAYRLERKERFYSKESMVEASEHAVIYHYVGNLFGRPWLAGNESALTELWHRYLDISPWKGMAQWSVAAPWIESLARVAAKIFPRPIIYRLSFSIHFHLTFPRRRGKTRQ